jgi:hypothetical protein
VGTSTVRSIVYSHTIFVGFFHFCFPLPLVSKVDIMIICSPFFPSVYPEILVSTWAARPLVPFLVSDLDYPPHQAEKVGSKTVSSLSHVGRGIPSTPGRQGGGQLEH